MAPTGPVAPKTATRLPLRSVPFAFRCCSTTATMPAAVVKAPDGSAITEISKCGGIIAFFAASSMSMARSGSRPPISTPVRLPSWGARENIASWTRPVTSLRSTSLYGTMTSKPASAAMFTSNGLTFFKGVMK